MSGYGEGPTFDGMGEIVSGELSRVGRKYRQRISELESIAKREHDKYIAADTEVRSLESSLAKVTAERDMWKNRALKPLSVTCGTCGKTWTQSEFGCDCAANENAELREGLRRLAKRMDSCKWQIQRLTETQI